MKECCRTYLTEQFGNDAEVVEAIYAEYVSSVVAKMAEADTALATGTWDVLSRAAHTIKGNALAAGDQQMGNTAIELQRAAKQEERDQAERLITDMRALMEQL